MNSEKTIHSLDDVKIHSELISSGSGNYYRNTIFFHFTGKNPGMPDQSWVQEEVCDMDLEDFENKTYLFNTEKSQIEVGFEVEGGRVQPVINQIH